MVSRKPRSILAAALGVRQLARAAWGWAPLVVPVAFVAACFIAPLVNLLWLSFHAPAPGELYGGEATLDNYAVVFGDPFFQAVLVRTLWVGVIVVGAALMVGYPMAIAAWFLPKPWRALFLAILLFPLMLSNVIRAYGWIAIMGRRGVLNVGLMELGVIETPLAMLYSFEAVTIALLTILLPYVVISVSNSLASLDRRYIEAAQALGAGPLRTFFKVIWPLTAPGVTSGVVIVFLLMLSAYVTITLVGGPRFKLLVSLVYDSAMNFEWPRAAALAFVLLAVGLFGASLLFALLRPDRVQGRR